MSTEYHVRRAKIQDAEQIHALFECYRQRGDFGRPFDPSNIQRCIEGNTIVVASTATLILGYYLVDEGFDEEQRARRDAVTSIMGDEILTLGRNSWRIQGAVHPEYRGKGVAASIIPLLKVTCAPKLDYLWGYESGTNSTAHRVHSAAGIIRVCAWASGHVVTLPTTEPASERLVKFLSQR